MRRRGPAFVLLAGVAVAALALVVAVAGDQRALVASSGTAPAQAIATLAPGERACTAPFTAPEDFARVRVWTSNVGLPAPNLELAVRPAAGGPPLARGVIEGGYRAAGPRILAIRRVPGRRSLSLCARNAGQARIALFGDVPPSEADSTVYDGRRLRTALAYDVLRSEPRSGLALVSTAFRRAALFRPAGVGPWTYWALLALVLLAVPALLVRALGEADASEVLGDPGRLAAEDESSERECPDDERRGEH